MKDWKFVALLHVSERVKSRGRRVRVPISLFLLAMLLAFSDFLAFGQFAYGGATGLVLVVVETSLRTSLVFGLLALVLEAYNVLRSGTGWLKYALVTTVICAVPPMTLSVYLNNYVLFTAFRGLEDLLSHLPVDRITVLSLFAFLFLSLEALTLELPRLLLAQRIWQMLLVKAGQKPSGTEDGTQCLNCRLTLSATQLHLFRPFNTFLDLSRPKAYANRTILEARHWKATRNRLNRKSIGVLFLGVEIIHKIMIQDRP